MNLICSLLTQIYFENVAVVWARRLELQVIHTVLDFKEILLMGVS